MKRARSRLGLLFSLLCCAWCAPSAAQAPDAAAFTVTETEPGTFAAYRKRSDAEAIEGVVIDAHALVDTLRERVLVQEGLGNLARVTVAPPPTRRWLSSSESPPEYLDFDAAYRFEHRFAAPFSAVQAELALAPLDDEDGAGMLLYPAASLLAVAIVLGLYALYRMSAVQVHFAQRRNNFVAAVSHELKTPLTAIRMYGEMLRDDMVETDAKRKEYYATITAETERLSRLINNVLELSRIERRERPVQIVAGDIVPVVREVVEVFRPYAEREGFALELAAATELPAARFDRDALTQVLFNLLDNALKYGRGGSERKIQVRCFSREDGRIGIAVADQGKGVDKSQLAAIFEPFYRAQNELTRSQPGTGIGLALVRGLVARMGGEVAGENREPGFEVRITLPCA